MLGFAPSVRANLKLFPILIGVAALSLGLRLVDFVSGHPVASPVAFAAEDEKVEDKESEPAPEKEAGEADESAGSTPSGLPTLSFPSTEERQLLTQLRDRREALERRERQLDLQEQTLQGVEKRIDEKISALEILEGQIKQHLRIFDEQEAAQLESIVQVYQQMKPKNAAARFERLNLEIQVDLATRMAGRKFAAILSAMNEDAAMRLTTELATRAQPPSLEEIQGSR